MSVSEQITQLKDAESNWSQTESQAPSLPTIPCAVCHGTTQADHLSKTGCNQERLPARGGIWAELGRRARSLPEKGIARRGSRLCEGLEAWASLVCWEYRGMGMGGGVSRARAQMKATWGVWTGSWRPCRFFVFHLVLVICLYEGWEKVKEELKSLGHLYLQFTYCFSWNDLLFLRKFIFKRNFIS